MALARSASGIGSGELNRSRPTASYQCNHPNMLAQAVRLTSQFLGEHI